MNYMKLLMMIFFTSVIIKTYLYPRVKNEPYLNWFLSTYKKNKISPLVDIFLGILYLIFYDKYKFSTIFFSNIFLSATLLPIAITDFRTKLIPNKLLALGIALGFFTAIFSEEISILNVLMSFAVCGGIMMAISLLTKGALGMGDAKLFACIGIFLGIQMTLGVIFLSAILSGLVGLFLLVFKKVDGKTTIPFAPFIAVCTIFIMIIS